MREKRDPLIKIRAGCAVGVGSIAIGCLYFKKKFAYIHLRFKYTVLGTHLSYQDSPSRIVSK